MKTILLCLGLLSLSIPGFCQGKKQTKSGKPFFHPQLLWYRNPALSAAGGYTTSEGFIWGLQYMGALPKSLNYFPGYNGDRNKLDEVHLATAILGKQFTVTPQLGFLVTTGIGWQQYKQTWVTESKPTGMGFSLFPTNNGVVNTKTTSHASATASAQAYYRVGRYVQVTGGAFYITAHRRSPVLLPTVGAKVMIF